MKLDRPFKHFLARPFLHLNPDDLRLLQAKFIELNRALHPDRLSHLSTQEREMAESLLSEINADFQCIKDPFCLLDKILQNSGLPPIQKESKTPPALAGIYFEVQEIADEQGPQSKAFQDRLQALVRQAQELLATTVKNISALKSVHSFTGFFDNQQEALSHSVPWSESDLLKLRALRLEMKYYTSFINDIKEKYPTHANTN